VFLAEAGEEVDDAGRQVVHDPLVDGHHRESCRRGGERGGEKGDGGGGCSGPGFGDDLGKSWDIFDPEFLPPNRGHHRCTGMYTFISNIIGHRIAQG
jgi:hypothetical protein